MILDHFDQFAEELVGFVALRGRIGSGGTDLHEPFECGEEGELPLGTGRDEGAEIDEVGMLCKDGQIFINGLAAIGLRQWRDEVFLGHGLCSCLLLCMGTQCGEKTRAGEGSCGRFWESAGS
jgi:hypothetical protein